MRNAIIIALVLLLSLSLAFNGKAYTPIKFYDSTGEITATYVNDLKVWIGTVQPTTATDYGIDISSAGFSEIKTVSIVPVKNTTAAADMPDVAIKTMTMTRIGINIRQANTAVVQILGINVLSGLPMIAPADVSSIQLIVRVTGK